MFSYKFTSIPQKNNAIYIRVTNNRRKTEISLGIELSEDNLENALSCNPSAANKKYARLFNTYNIKMEDLKLQLMETGRANISITTIKDLIKDAIFGKVEKVEEKKEEKIGSFLPHFNKFAESRQAKRTQEIYKATIARMKAYSKNLSELDFEDITVEWLRAFDEFLAKTSPKKNARNIHFRNIRAVMKDAFKADMTAAHPFDRFNITAEPTRKRSFSTETIRKIFNAKVEPWQQKYLDFFKLTFMLIGINVIDLCNATEINNGRLEYKRSKTHKLYSIKVEPEALEIINKYSGEKKLLNMVEPYLDYRHFYNNLCIGLKKIREQLEIDELTTYWARHSWATIARKLGVPVDDIALALGHHNKVHQTTFIYIDDDEIREKVDEANRKVLDWVLYGKQEGQTSE